MFRGRNKFVVPATAIALIAMAACFMLSNSAFAATNQDISFEGKIVSSSGTNITDGSYNAEFTIYTGCTNNTGAGCTAVWKEDYLTGGTPVVFTSGTFQVNLGSICPFTAGTCEGNTNTITSATWDTSPLYVSINLGTTTTSCSSFTTCGGGTGVMTPYILLTSSPYAMDAANADSLGGVAASNFNQKGTNNTWTGTNYIQTASVTALQVGSSSSATVLGVDTSGNQVLLGSNSNINGKLVINSSGATGYVGLTVSTTAFTGYNLTLPSAAPTAASQCLQSSSGTFTNLSWGSCGGGGSSTSTITLEPEYAGAVFSASGSNNAGYMQSDHVAVSSGYTDNYYDWTTNQTTAQTYDIVVGYQIPSNYNSLVTAFKVWSQVDSTSNNSVQVDVHDGGTDCSSGFQPITPSGTTWSQQSFPSLAGCTLAANNMLTLDFRLSATYASSTMYNARLGEISWQYQ